MSQYPTDLFRTSCGATTPLELNVSGPGWASGERRVFEQPFALIGRHKLAPLHLEDATVSRRHAYLQQFGRRVFCVDLGSRAGIHWEGEPRLAGWLGPDQRIQIGPFTLELPMAARAGKDWDDQIAKEWNPLQDRVKDSRLLPYITVEGDNKVLAQMRMNRKLVLVGSSPACRVCLRQPGIARYHCSLVSTPEGVWMIDLLNETGTCLNGQPVRWALVEEGGQLRVGPYVLRFSYPNACTATPTGRPSEIRAETLVQTAEDTSESRRRPFQDEGVPGPDKPILRQSATEVSSLAPAVQAEIDQAREHLRDAEVIRQQLAESQAECVQLRARASALEIQVAEAAGLQVRLQALEVSVEAVCAERDQWQAETQTLQSRLTAEAAERVEWQQRLEAAQQQLVEEREGARAVEARLGQESIALQEVRTEFAVQHAEFNAALQRLQETQDELARFQDKACGLQAEVDQTRERLREAEALKQQLADAQAKHDQLCTRVPELEERATSADHLRERLRVADLGTEQFQLQLRTAESRMAELEVIEAECVRLRDRAGTLETQVVEMSGLQARLQALEVSVEAVCAERDQWQAETQTLRTKLATQVAEQEEWQQRLETAQQQLIEKSEAVRAAEARMDRESGALQGVQADFAARNAEYSAVLQRLQETQDELARSQDEGRGFQAEVDQIRERLRDAEVIGQQLTDSQAECVRLREQAYAHEIQVAEATGLQGRLETAEAKAHELETVCAQRDQWQTEAQTLQTRLASEGVEREEWQQQLEAAQQQLIEKSEAVRAAEALMDKESATLQVMRAEFAAQHAEYNAALKQLQKIQDEFDRSQDEAHELQADLDQAREGLREAEVIGRQLAESQTECVRLRDQVNVFEIQVAEMVGLQDRLEAAETNARELQAVCAQRDQWQTEAQTLHNRLASDSSKQEQLDRLAAELYAACEERDRLHIEQQTFLTSSEQASARVSDLERALADTAAIGERAVAEARAGWESERQTLEARLEQERQTHNRTTQAAVRSVQIRADVALREIQTRAAAEQEEWRKRLEGAEAQIVCERGLFQEQSEQTRRQITILQAERDRLTARLTQAELFPQAAEERSRDEAGHVAESAQLRQLAMVDQIFAEFTSIQGRHLLVQAARTQNQNKPVEQGRPHVHSENECVPIGEQHRPMTTEQAAETVWAEADPVWKQGCGACADAPQDASTPVEVKQSIENLHGSLPERKDETGQGLWQKVLNLVRGK